MGYINQLWQNDPSYINSMKLKQILVLAGDGIINHEVTYQEIRLFFTKIDAAMIYKFMKECSSEDKEDKFDNRGFVLQDLVNEVGRRFGYSVTYGLYKGKRGDTGFDGLWKSPDGSSIIMESKTSDAYTLNIDTLIGYREKLIKNNQIERSKNSILIVLGRNDKNTFSNLIKGSNEAQNIRIISIMALYHLLEIYESSSKTNIVQKKIMELLIPHDFIQLDNLVDLVFLEEDNMEISNNEIKSCVVIPDLPDEKLPIGKFVYTAMRNLSNSGYIFSDEQLKHLVSKEWSHEALRLDYPFFKFYNTSETKGHYIGKDQRFYAKTFLFGNIVVYITKELFEKNRKPFIKWYKSLKDTL